MREILFRGQTRRYGEKVKMNGEKVPSNWVYGGVCQGKGDFSIIYGSMDMELEQPTEKRVVYTDTIGQYTGLTDKNGTKVFEGDIVVVDLVHFPTQKGVVTYTKDFFGLDIKDVTPIQHCIDYAIRNGQVEVIGNMHDNPELLKEGKDK